MLGAPDLAGANNWIEKALSADRTAATITIADAMFKGVHLPQNRARAISLWTVAGQQRDGELAWNNMALELCTASDPGLRDPKRGLEAALKATATNKTPSWLDTLSACQAAGNDFDAAGVTEQEALVKADPDSDLAANLRERIELYRAHKGYVQPPYDAAPAHQ
jgi:hypothetical protein